MADRRVGVPCRDIQGHLERFGFERGATEEDTVVDDLPLDAVSIEVGRGGETVEDFGT